MSLNRLAAKAVALQTDLSVGERRGLLEMLGLVEPGGRVVSPDDLRRNGTAVVVGTSRRPQVVHAADDMRTRPRYSSAPEGLRASPRPSRDTDGRPPRPRPTPVKKPAREPAACGTVSGFRRHQRRDETPCEECRSARNAINREYERQRRARRRGQ